MCVCVCVCIYIYFFDKTDVVNKLMVTRREREGINRELGIDIYTLSYIK